MAEAVKLVFKRLGRGFHWKLFGAEYTRVGRVVNFRWRKLWFRRVDSQWVLEWDWP
jgi:hypothetical protein